MKSIRGKRFCGRPRPPKRKREGAVLVLAAFLLVMIFAFLAFTVDVGYMSIVGSELQNAADAAALGSAMELADGPQAVFAAAQDVAAAAEEAKRLAAESKQKQAEKELGLDSKRDIEAFGVERFVELCKERVRKFSAIQTEQSIRL
ncbi:MAG TPA: hypothetical protein EYP77_02575, partial [Anaerolineae bacterium]|nr:hypothetical protein [Anaerolineae bacterium]